MRQSGKVSHSDLGMSDGDTKLLELSFLPTILKWLGQNLDRWSIQDGSVLSDKFMGMRKQIFEMLYDDKYEYLLSSKEGTRALNCVVCHNIR